jgi:hypothetical protein
VLGEHPTNYQFRTIEIKDDRSRPKDVIPMVERKRQPRWVHLIGITALLTLLPGCQSPGPGQGSWVHHGTPGSSNVVYRPSYELPGTKPLYLSGYAGANYGPVFRRVPAGSLAPAPAANSPGVAINQGTWDTE